MKRNFIIKALTTLSLLAFTVFLPASPTGAQTFSIDYQGPTISLPDGKYFTTITEGDILAKVWPGKWAPPRIDCPGGFMPMPGLALPLHPAAQGHPPGAPGWVEIDGLSYGLDFMRNPAVFQQVHWYFSVDEFAMGLPGIPFPSVWTEGSWGALEASADVFRDTVPGGMPPGPIPPFGVPPGNTAVRDGNGLFPWGGQSLSLIEPNFPMAGVPDFGDNLDAMEVDTAIPAGGLFPVYFSLDSGIWDPLEAVWNTASAAANGPFVGGDVLITPGPGLAPFVFAAAGQLGLDIAGGLDTDDLDALVLVENGSGIFEPSQQPFDWLNGTTDMLLFSVRRGSAVIGLPDSILGIPICEGDILTTPLVNSPMGPFPGIWIAAENLGLATQRSGEPQTDDLNALDLRNFSIPMNPRKVPAFLPAARQ